ELSIRHLRRSRAYSLSGGERRRLEITRALVTRPKFMLLDEPFSGVDPIAVGELQGFIRQLRGRGIGVLLTDHNVRETIRICDHVCIISEGRVLKYGTPAEVVADPVVRATYLGTDFRMPE
ncbi:MAG TPA: ATP-binding cassette domain-containing protein, partial [Planctomycetota bacterium]|nr:ATP-binding cassette domain-containing protein [Planctomycetota bacterium]